MKKPVVTLKCIALLFAISISSIGISTSSAKAFDMDCKVILCLAGGFPSGCSDAYGYMIDRITNRPNPKPPFGFCAMSDGSEYTNHNVNYQFLGNSYDCPVGSRVYTGSSGSRDGDRQNAPQGPFCYTSSSTVWTGGRDGGYQTVYYGQSRAQPVNFQLQITIEPGTSHEYRSPLFRIHTPSGYVSQQPL